jgi:site-specific DNA recombinase
MTLAAPAEWLLYLRKSVGYAGISRQRTSTTDHLASRGGKVVDGGEFSDADKTAFRNTSRDIDAPLPPRPDFDRMLAEMARRPGVGVAAWHADRLGRDPEACEILIRACRRGGHLISTTRGGDYDVTTANGRDHLRTDIQRAAHEVDHNVERLVEAKAEYAAEGRWLGGLRPFGWRPAGDGVLVLDEAEAALITQGCADILAGVPVRAVARAWNKAGSTGSGGGRWTTSTVHKVLSRPRNAGLAEHHGKIVDLGLDDEGNPKRARWPAITDEGTWRAVHAILSDPSRRTNKGGTAPGYLLSGIALCGGCGLGVVVNASAEGTPRYRCSRHARGLPPKPGPHASRKAADIDAYIAYLAVGRMKQDDAAQLLRADRSQERGALLGKRAAAEAKSRRDFELREDDILTDLEFTTARRKSREQLAEVDEKLAALEQADALAPFLADPEGTWESAGLERRRALVSALMYVTLMPGAKFSRPPGWKQGDGQFDPRLVDVRWVRRLPSDG